MIKLPYIKKMHRELQRAAPEDYTVYVIRQGKRLFTAVSCFDADYCAPWYFDAITEKYGL